MMIAMLYSVKNIITAIFTLKLDNCSVNEASITKKHTN